MLVTYNSLGYLHWSYTKMWRTTVWKSWLCAEALNLLSASHYPSLGIIHLTQAVMCMCWCSLAHWYHGNLSLLRLWHSHLCIRNQQCVFSCSVINAMCCDSQLPEKCWEKCSAWFLHPSYIQGKTKNMHWKNTLSAAPSNNSWWQPFSSFPLRKGSETWGIIPTSCSPSGTPPTLAGALSSGFQVLCDPLNRLTQAKAELSGRSQDRPVVFGMHSLLLQVWMRRSVPSPRYHSINSPFLFCPSHHVARAVRLPSLASETTTTTTNIPKQTKSTDSSRFSGVENPVQLHLAKTLSLIVHNRKFQQ